MSLVHALLISAALNATGGFDRAPPGEILQSIDFNVTGHTDGAYVAVVSREFLGHSPSWNTAVNVYQPYLSIYRRSAESRSLALIYQAKEPTDTVPIVVHGERIFTRILTPPALAVAQLMGTTEQQLLVYGKDTSSTPNEGYVEVIRVDGATDTVWEAARVSNWHELTPTVSSGSIRLSGPDCPTNISNINCQSEPIEKVDGILHYDVSTAQWTISPQHFNLSANPFVLRQPNLPTNVTTPPPVSVIDVAVNEPFYIYIPFTKAPYRWNVEEDLGTPTLAVTQVGYVLSKDKGSDKSGVDYFGYCARKRGTSLLALDQLDPSNRQLLRKIYYVVIAR